MRASIFAASLVLVAVLAACQGSDLVSPASRSPQTSGKKGGIGGTNGATVNLTLSGGYSTPSPQPGALSVGGRRVTFETPFAAPILITLNVDPNGGAPDPGLLPKSDQIDWRHCIWNADIAAPYDPSNVPAGALDLWDAFMNSHASVRARLLFLLVDGQANGSASWDHQSLTRWFTTEGSQKYMWELEAGAEPTLSLVEPVASWDGTTFEFSEGVVRITRTRCGTRTGPDGCVPARGKGNRPTVACRNDGLAFPRVIFRARVD